MNGTKTLVTSKTFWGLAITLIGVMLDAFNVKITPEELGVVTQFSNLAIEVGGIVFAAIGRYSASKAITSVV